LKKVDPRLNIMYEDLGGCPFAYESKKAGGKNDLDLCTELVSMRGKQEDVGYIFKGFYANAGGADPMLNKDENALRALADARRPFLASNETGWRDNLDQGLKVLKNLIESKAKRKSVTLLMEDGLWEIRPWYPVCLVAEAMWNPYREKGSLDDCTEVYSTRTKTTGSEPEKTPKS
jgi:hypothetical protein